MKILVSGATGFIGSHLMSRLQTEYVLYGVVRTGPPERSSIEVHWIEQDLTQRLDYSRLPSQVDVVIHLAQSKFYRDFPAEAADIFAVNVNSTFNLLEYARQVGAQRFIFASTGGLYGYGSEKFVETDPANPQSFYFNSKYIAEKLVENYQQFFHTIIFRLFFAYGARQTRTMLIPRLAHAVQTGEPISLQGENGLQINPIHVSDVVTSFERALSLEGHHLINLGGPQVLSLREIGHMIAAQLGRTPLFTTNTDQEPTQLIGDISKMTALLGSPRIRFSDGVLETCREVADRSNESVFRTTSVVG